MREAVVSYRVAQRPTEAGSGGVTTLMVSSQPSRPAISALVSGPDSMAKVVTRARETVGLAHCGGGGPGRLYVL